MPTFESVDLPMFTLVKMGPGDLNGIPPAADCKCPNPSCKDPTTLPSLVKMLGGKDVPMLLMITHDAPGPQPEHFPNISTKNVTVIAPVTPAFEKRIMKMFYDKLTAPLEALREVRSWSGKEEGAPRVFMREAWLKGVAKRPAVSVLRLRGDLNGIPVRGCDCTNPDCGLTHDEISQQLAAAQRIGNPILIMLVCDTEILPRAQPANPTDLSTSNVAIIGPLTPSNEKSFVKMLKEKGQPREALEAVRRWKGRNAPRVMMHSDWLK